MTTPKIIVTVLTVAAIGAVPGAAGAASDGANRTPPGKLATNHNEVMTGSSGPRA